MAGIMDLLFGSDGVGGQPGAAGKFLDFATGADIQANQPDPQTGTEALKKYGKDLARLPFTLAKLPLDFLSDPTTFLQGRNLDIGAVLSPTYRKEKKEQQKIAENAEKARAIYMGVKTADDFARMLLERTPDQRAGLVMQAEQAGVPSQDIETALGFANSQDQRAGAARGYARDAVGDTIPGELIDAAVSTPEDALKLVMGAQRTDAVAQRSAEVAKRADRSLSLSERREQRLAQEAATRPVPKSEDEKFQRRLKERSATRLFDSTAEATETGATDLISGISDPGMAADLRSRVPEFSVKEAEKAAKAAIEQALPPNSRRNLAARKAAKKVLREKMKALPQNTGLDSPILDDSPLPTDPAERLTLAASLGEQLLAAGFPPEKAAEELLRRGFSAEELPE